MFLSKVFILLPLQYTRSAFVIPDDHLPVSRRGRLLEVLDDPVILGRLDAKTQELVRARPAIDEENDRHVFDLSHGWPSFVSTPRGNLTLNMSSVITSRYSASFETLEDPNLVVRFSHDCVMHGLSTIKVMPHFALSEYWFGSAASAVRVAANYHFVSPPVPFPARGLFLEVTAEETARCRSANAAVRFVLFHKPMGESLRAFLARSPRGRLDPVFALKLGRALMESIKALHTAGVVHGSIRLEDVYIDAARNHSVRLSGFLPQRVAWLNKTTGKSLIRESPATLDAFLDATAHLQSPWELLEGPAHHFSVRDDVYRVVQLISIMLNGLELDTQLERIGSEGNLAEYKLMNPVLLASVASNPFRCLPISVDSKTRLMSLMHTINARVFDMHSVGHDDIIAKLNEMVVIAKTMHVRPVLGALRCDEEPRVSEPVVAVSAARRVSIPTVQPQVRTFHSDALVSASMPPAIRAPERGVLKRPADNPKEPATPEGSEPSSGKKLRRTGE